PDYAAPEQISGEPATTATDVHALGAVLHELLTGARPFGRVGTSLGNLKRVLEQAPPPLSRVEGLDRVSRRALAGDLETIVQKALQKEPARRYPSAGAFAEDLRRYLAGRPIEARPDSAGYRFAKLVGRHRAVSATAALLLVAVGLGVGSTIWQARAARIEAERGNAVGRFLFSVFEAADPDLNPGTPVTALELLEAGLARVDSLDAGPEARVDLLTTLGQLFIKLGHADRAEDLLRRAVRVARESLPARDPAVAQALDALGVQLSLQGNLTEAEELLREALAARRAGHATPTDVAATEGNLALTLRRRGLHPEAETMYLAAIRRLEGVSGGDSAAFASELMGLGQVYQFLGRTAAAESLFRTVRRLEEGGGQERPRLATVIHNLGVVLAEQERYDEALAAHEEALAVWQRLFPRGHPEIPRSLEAMARVLERQNRMAGADSLYREAIDRWSELYGAETSAIATIRANQANLRYFAGDYDAAAAAYRDGIRIWRANDEKVLLGAGLRNLGIIERERGDLRSADTLLAASLDLRRSINGEAHASVAETRTAIAGLRNQQGRHPDAERHARMARDQLRELVGPDHRLTRYASLELGVAIAAQGRYEEADSVLAPLHAEFSRSAGVSDLGRGRAALWLGIAAAGLGRPDRARELIREALPALANLPKTAPERLRAEREANRLGQ
ncbi:MAG: tetratricopeptide repeat-containing protein kinase family protein, partial [Gemmatimonadales bacterium]